MTPSKSRKSKDGGKPAGGQACSSCGAAVRPEARFCHACGASLEAGPSSGKWPAVKLAGLGAAVAGSIAVAVIAVVTLSERESPAPFSSPAPAPMSDLQPDLSQMTPRETADRLFNRVMMASEQGKRAEALSFVPMAIEAYGSLPVLDRDALYHLGHIHSVAGDRANVDRQIAAMRQGAPNHLLALVLEHGIAERSGDRESVSRILTAFAAAYDAEIAQGRPEYEAHRNIIERFRATAASRATPFMAIPSTAEAVGAKSGGGAQEGALLFATNCSACHGLAAAGSDKGPALVNKIYEPGHHADASFYRAVREGVRSHHWSFGNMPPIAGVSDDEVGRILAYVRELQRAAGIE